MPGLAWRCRPPRTILNGRSLNKDKAAWLSRTEFGGTGHKEPSPAKAYIVWWGPAASRVLQDRHRTAETVQGERALLLIRVNSWNHFLQTAPWKWLRCRTSIIMHAIRETSTRPCLFTVIILFTGHCKYMCFLFYFFHERLGIRFISSNLYRFPTRV